MSENVEPVTDLAVVTEHLDQGKLTKPLTIDWSLQNYYLFFSENNLSSIVLENYAKEVIA